MRSTDSEIVGYLRVVQILDSLPALVGYVDLDLRIVYANKLIETWYRRPLDELVGMQLKTLFSAEHYQTVEGLLGQVLAGTEVNEEREIQYPDGETRQVNLNYIPDSSNGQVLGYFFLVQDVTVTPKLSERLSSGISSGVPIQILCPYVVIERIVFSTSYNTLSTSSSQLVMPL